jgi:mono/diheme cytochrome c family protein
MGECMAGRVIEGFGQVRRALVGAAAFLVASAAIAAADEAQVKRGAYLFAAADCVGCHTDVKGNGAALAGGRPLATPFGTFFSPNITPDKATGIGNWSLADFRRALREGIAPGGYYYFPVFPYTSFTSMTDEDVADLFAFLQTQKAVAQPSKTHDVKPPFGWRFTLIGWRMLFFKQGPMAPVAGQDAASNRGRYLAEAVAHCGECHTPRNFLGGIDRSRAYSGDPNGPDGQKTPNITPDPKTGIGNWRLDEITKVLKTGETPDFDEVGKGMAEVVKGTSRLTDDDRTAIAIYLKSLPPVATPKTPPKTE